MKKLIKWLNWVDDNLIKILVGIFIFLAPLYPKLPLKMINYTYIAIRFEDLYMAGLTLIFFIQILRKKIQLKKEFLWLFLLFWLSVSLSFLYGTFVIKTVVYKHLGLLHTLRRIEYMLIFFIAASSINTKKDFFRYLSLALIAVILVTVYGIGQKFIGWPAVQTMNPEYAKGYLLFLTPEARVSSTFAGHYDLATYLVLFMPIIWAFFFYKKRVVYFLVFFLSLFVLILTASRVSYIAYLISTLGFLIFLKKPKYLILSVALTILLTPLSTNLTSRLTRTFQVKRIFVNQSTGQVIVPQKITTKELPAGSIYIAINQKTSDNQQTMMVDETLLKQKILENVRNEASKSGKKLTASEEDALVASLAAALKPINTLLPDISFATRLQVEWPRAIKAFIKSPLLGTGPSSITEATDNDYLRWLGETGIVGTLIFLLLLFSLIKFIFNSTRKLKDDTKVLYFGFLFGLAGMLINAGYIDIFEASKVAFNFWLIAGLFIGSINLLLVKNK